MYRICDLYIDLKVNGRTKKNAEAYLCNGEHTPDIVIRQDYAKALKTYPQFAEYDFPEDVKFSGLNYMLERDTFARKILSFNGMVIHSSAVVVDDKAYFFSAVSGTGKSTHTKLWLELFKDQAYILNDDKPAVRILDDSIYAYGTPWCGSSDINTNSKVKLQGICFIERDDKNWIKSMNAQMVVFRLLHASLININRDEMDREMDIINVIVDRIPIYEMGCTPTIEAAQMAYDVMSKGEVK